MVEHWRPVNAGGVARRFGAPLNRRVEQSRPPIRTNWVRDAFDNMPSSGEPDEDPSRPTEPAVRSSSWVAMIFRWGGTSDLS